MSRPYEPSMEDEYNEWYSSTHLTDVTTVPGFVGARRYRRVETAVGTGYSAHGYLAIYELDTDDIDGALSELVRRSSDGRIPISGALSMDPPPELAVFELLP